MNINFKDIHIGALISAAVSEQQIEISRICNFLKCSVADVENTFQSNRIDTEVLMRWSKLLEYDFFRIYSQHLILYAPPSPKERRLNKKEGKSKLPQFRKNIYTKQLIDYIVGQISKGEKTRSQIMKEYKIPKTTLYKWIIKYGDSEKEE